MGMCVHGMNDFAEYGWCVCVCDLNEEYCDRVLCGPNEEYSDRCEWSE